MALVAIVVVNFVWLDHFRQLCHPSGFPAAVGYICLQVFSNLPLTKLRNDSKQQSFDRLQNGEHDVMFIEQVRSVVKTIVESFIGVHAHCKVTSISTAN